MSDTLLKILDLARWAPSGDNVQCWSFEIVASDHIAIHGFDTREHCVYDFNGHASHMAHGALLQTLEIAATSFGLKAEWSVRDGCGDSAPIYDVRLTQVPGMPVDPLCSCIEKRTVQRRPMRMNALSTEWIQALEQAVGKDYQLQFFSTISLRSKVAGLLWRGAHIRLTCPEAYPVHREIIEWGARFSDDRIPEQAVGVDPLTARLMYWVLQSWKRVVFFNGFMMGTVWPRIQLDVIPAIACSAHVLLQPRVVPTSLQDRVEAGMALQRLWLTATRLGLHLQPQMTPLIFRWYVQAGQAMSASTKINAAADRLTNQLDEFFGLARGDSAMFFCRIGVCQPPVSRSLRKSLSLLMRG